jgi:transposase-like protein
MSRPGAKGNVTCPNIDCAHFSSEDGKRIVLKGRNCAGRQVFLCRHCGKYFSESSRSLMYRKRLGAGQVAQLCRLVLRRHGIRAIARQTGLNKNTVSRWLREFSSHADEIGAVLQKELRLSNSECEEFWRHLHALRRRPRRILSHGAR